MICQEMVMCHSYPEVYKPPTSVVSFFVFDYGYSHAAYRKHRKKETRSRVSRLKTYRYLHHFLLTRSPFLCCFCLIQNHFSLATYYLGVVASRPLESPEKLIQRGRNHLGNIPSNKVSFTIL